MKPPPARSYWCTAVFCWGWRLLKWTVQPAAGQGHNLPSDDNADFKRCAIVPETPGTGARTSAWTHVTPPIQTHTDDKLYAIAGSCSWFILLFSGCRDSAAWCDSKGLSEHKMRSISRKSSSACYRGVGAWPISLFLAQNLQHVRE